MEVIKKFVEIDLPLQRYIRNLNKRQVYNDRQCVKILNSYLPEVEKYFNVTLLPTYCFLRKYLKGEQLKKHKDRTACEYSVTLNIETNTRWPLNFQLDENNVYEGYTTSPGDAILYKGCEYTHWRRPLEEGFQNQLFLHYVDANGPHACQHKDVMMKRGVKGDINAWKIARPNQGLPPQYQN